MDFTELLTTRLAWLPPSVLSALEGRLQRLPAVQRQVDREYASLLAGLEPELKPYREEFPACTALPQEGRPRQEVLAEMQALKEREEDRWREGYVSGAVYHGDEAHIEFLNQVYALQSQSNPLHVDIWPSAARFEAEIVAMTAHLLNGKAEEGVCGTVTSGGTESILLAMKTYRDRARQERGIRRPEMVLPVSAHAAFDKAGQYFNIKIRRIPLDDHYRASLPAARRAINRNTIVVVGSAPSFPHGAIDPIPALAALAQAHGVGFHTDACLGGFILPWAQRLGYPAPAFDFSVPGVTSISADTHKFGYAAKGTSVILYRSPELRRYQYYAVADWPGGLYFSPTFAGSRPGALSAACWAALVSVGEAGYLEAARRILETAAVIRQGVASIPGLWVLGEPLFVIAFASDEVDIYQVLEFMSRRGWSLNGLHHPQAIHLCVTLRHTQPGVGEKFLSDLEDGVEWARANPSVKEGLAPIYGMAATMPLRGLVTGLLKRYIDLLYKV